MGLNKAHWRPWRHHAAILVASLVTLESMVAVANRAAEERICTDLCEAEDVVDEEQHVLSFHVTEVLCDCQTCKQQGRVKKLSSIKVMSI